jgi:hypothetical protein
MSAVPIVYHAGFLAIDRAADDDLDRRATALLTKAETGEVVLTQRRLGAGQYEYIARVRQP